MTTTLPALELKAGDVIQIAGQAFSITSPWLGPRGRIIAYQMHNGEQVGAVEFPPDMILTVARPEPDAELVEVMVKAYKDTLSEAVRCDGWNLLRDEDKATGIASMRAALAAAREAGLL